MNPDKARELILQACAQAGLDDCGIADAFEVPVDRDKYERYLTKGLFSDMQYLKDTVEQRFDPSRVLSDVKSVVIGVSAYGSDLEGLENRPSGAGFISRYAWGQDYHRVVKEMLNRVVESVRPVMGGEWKVFVDTGPVFEKAYAAKAGLGFIGKNSLLIHPEFGSYVFLGTILTTVKLTPTKRAIKKSCGSCTLCVDTCPAQAITPDGIDANRCIAHINNMYRGDIPQHFDFKGNLFGCDICQDVCPHNIKALKLGHPWYLPEHEENRYPDLDWAIGLSNKQFRQTYRGTPVGIQRPRRFREIAKLIKGQD